MSKGLDLVDNASKVQEEDNPSVEDPKHSDLNEENPMPSPQQEEAAIKKKYGGLLPKKNPLISKDHERAFFDSADWALGKQGTQKSKGPLEALCPKLQPTPQQQARARRSAYAPADESEGMCTTVVAQARPRRSAYAPADESEVDGENAIPSSEDQNCVVDSGSNEGTHSKDRNCPQLIALRVCSKSTNGGAV